MNVKLSNFVRLLLHFTIIIKPVGVREIFLNFIL